MNKRYLPYLFILPLLFGTLLFRIIPSLGTILVSFTEWPAIAPPEFVGVGNYRELFSRGDTWLVLSNTVIFTIGFTFISMVAGLGLALLVNKRIKGIVLFRTIYYLPVIASTVVVGLVWDVLLATNFGLVNQVLRILFGIDGPSWLGDADFALFSLIIVYSWKYAGYLMIIFLSGLQDIPKRLYESARLDGASSFQVFTNVTLPLLTPTTFFILIITLIHSFRTFELTYVMTEGGPRKASMTLGYYIYQNGFEFFRFGYSSSLAVILLLVAGTITFLNFHFENRWVHYQA